jgi:preprotein translocase subunit SecB
MSSSPKVGFNFESNIENLSDDTHELTLTFNVKAEVENETLYLVELKQCGVFTISIDDKDITLLPMHSRARLGIGYLPQESSIF